MNPHEGSLQSFYELYVCDSLDAFVDSPPSSSHAICDASPRNFHSANCYPTRQPPLTFKLDNHVSWKYHIVPSCELALEDISRPSRSEHSYRRLIIRNIPG